MVKESVTVRIPSGFETRPIAMIVQVAGKYSSRISLASGDRRVNAKSIMGMMTLGLDDGETIDIIAEGEDEEQALAGLKEYLTKGTDK